ncbi:MAG: protein-methionine-sulfoxide reductase heme-binding subunit MsrQ [Immundisolibacter sp.]|uniref:protein-methionine-sulfoxide reductase heme-binding subunit MsrQ n=1 Tax=Immundisolibacter sp. TaxID=1934948 RepID=UPI003D0EF79D
MPAAALRARLWQASLWVLAIAPALALLWRALGDRLGANPVEALTLELGQWALRFVLLTLAATPVRRLTGWSVPLRHRRLLGLTAASYALLHLLVYMVLDQGLLWSQIIADVLKRPFITAGMAAFALLLPLAATSFDGAIRRLGARRWQALHRLVYVAAGLALLHFWWKVKADTREPAIYLAVFVLLLAARWLALRRRAPTPAAPPAPRSTH